MYSFLEQLILYKLKGEKGGFWIKESMYGPCAFQIGGNSKL